MSAFATAGGTGPGIFDPATLPGDDNVNPYTFCVELAGGRWFLQKGRMIAYYGQMSFNGVGYGPLDALVRSAFHSPMHAADWVVAEGTGKMLLADRAFDVNSFDLDEGNLTVRSGNLLGRAEAIGHLAAGPEDLFALDSRDNDALQRQLATKTTSLSLPPRSRANFLAVFPLGGQQVDGAELKLSVLDGVPPTLADTVGALRPEPQAPPSDTAGEPEQK